MSMAEDDDAGRASEDKAALEYSLLLVISADELDSDSVNGALESDEAVSAGAVPSSELLDISTGTVGSETELLSDEQAARNAVAAIAEREASIPLLMGLILGCFGRNSRNHADRGAGRLDEVGGSDFQLQAAFARTHVDVGELHRGFVNENRKILLEAERAATAADVAGQRRQVLERDSVNFLVAAHLGGPLQVHFEVARYHTN